jgi:hypothetical protein
LFANVIFLENCSFVKGCKGDDKLTLESIVVIIAVEFVSMAADIEQTLAAGTRALKYYIGSGRRKKGPKFCV